MESFFYTTTEKRIPIKNLKTLHFRFVSKRFSRREVKNLTTEMLKIREADCVKKKENNNQTCNKSKSESYLKK